MSVLVCVLVLMFGFFGSLQLRAELLPKRKELVLHVFLYFVVERVVFLMKPAAAEGCSQQQIKKDHDEWR